MSHSSSGFVGRAYVVVQDEETVPTHNLDPEMGYRVVDEDMMIDADHWTAKEFISDELLPKYEALCRLGDDTESEEDYKLAESVTVKEMVSFLEVQEGSVLPLLSACPEQVRFDKEVLKAAISVSGLLLSKMDEHAISDAEIVAAAVEDYPDALDFAASELLMNPGLFDHARNFPDNFLNESYLPLAHKSSKSKDVERFLWQAVQYGMSDQGGISTESASLGDWSGYFGKGLVQARCIYLKSHQANGETVEDRVFRLIFQFITNGNYADQPFLRVRIVKDKKGKVVDKTFFWFDKYTSSNTPFTSETFGARIIYDVVGLAAV